MIKTRTWVAGILFLLLLSAGAALLLQSGGTPGMVANIYQDGVCVRSVDLSTVADAETYTVESSLGTNVIRVEPGKICVLEADCSDQVCVRAGWLADSAAPIVCLPHRLVIRLEPSAASGQIDAVSQ